MSDAVLSIDLDERKRLGQYFTGEPLARVLAALADATSARSIIDPMAGSGDMLVASQAMGAAPTVVTAVEIDPDASAVCAERLAELRGDVEVRTGDAFQPSTWLKDRDRSWDLVITNPPYVRYQRTTAASSGRIIAPSATEIRQGLMDILDQRPALAADDARVFKALAGGYSGLADLAVPSWILCASLVAPGGRLAMVVPDTWLTRDYALPVLYLLRRCFDVEVVVEDGEANWFEDALVRTTLLVARRIPTRPWAQAIEARSYVRARLTSGAADSRSLVGALHPRSIRPERHFAERLARISRADTPIRTPGLRAGLSDDAALGARLVAQAGSTPWGQTLEPLLRRDEAAGGRHFDVPHRLQVAACVDPERLCTLEDLGWNVGQGLRTGANRFFYCEVEEVDGGRSIVRFDRELSPELLEVPTDLLRVAVRKQSDLLASGGVPGASPGRVLLLDRHALDEDIARAEAIGVRTPFEAIPEPLADVVRRAARLNVGSPEVPRRIPELSAVVTNIRRPDAAHPERPPRFWYQLPRLADRHVGQVLIPRVNHGHPSPTTNPTGVLIDANFSTFWPKTAGPRISASALACVLSSSWASAALESVGTVLGGGALKIEATQLRRLPLPRLTGSAVSELERLGRTPSSRDTALRDAVDSIVWETAEIGARSQRAVEALSSELLRDRSATR